MSGYGEYEFTSQAMEYGIRHYILKPCDEDKIVAVMNDAKKEVDKRREYHTLKRELLSLKKQEKKQQLILQKHREQQIHQNRPSEYLKKRWMRMR